MPEIAFKILYYEHRYWWQRKYDVRLATRGWVTTPNTTWVASFWTANGARKFVDRESKRHDFKTIDEAILKHDEN